MRVRVRLVSLIVAALVSAPPFSSAQSAADAAVPRDNTRAAAPTGTARVRGRVTAEDTGQPLRRATVRLSGPQLRGQRITMTDRDGRYEFRSLPTGRYAINVQKEPYLSWSYGQRRAGDPGRLLQVQDQQTVDKIDFALPRGAVITGRVLDEFGDPAIDVRIATLRSQYTPQGRRLVNYGRGGNTNDAGEFRIFGVQPGQYYISATAPSRFSGPPPETSDERSGYAPTYFPGTPDAAQAQLITVEPGQVLRDIAIMLVPAETARITGVVLDEENKIVKRGSVNLMPRGPLMGVGGGAAIGPDGTFTVANVAPGAYILRAATGLAGPGMAPKYSIASVTVNGADLTDVRLLPVVPVPVTGRVVVDPETAATLPRGVRIMANPSDPDEQFLMMMPNPPAPLADDLTFALKLPAGTFNVNATAPPGWMVKSVRQNGSDVTAHGIDVGSSGASDVEVELTNRVATLTGLVTDDRGDPSVASAALLFPDERGVPPTQARGGLLRTDEGGKFSFRTVRPGTYRLIALDHVEPTQWMDPDYLDQFRARATTVTLGAGETKNVELKVATGP